MLSATAKFAGREKWLRQLLYPIAGKSRFPPA